VAFKGGAFLAVGGAHLDMRNVILANGRAQDGAIFLTEGSSAHLQNITIEHHHAWRRAAISVNERSFLKARYCHFYRNEADEDA